MIQFVHLINCQLEPDVESPAARTAHFCFCSICHRSTICCVNKQQAAVALTTTSSNKREKTKKVFPVDSEKGLHALHAASCCSDLKMCHCGRREKKKTQFVKHSCGQGLGKYGIKEKKWMTESGQIETKGGINTSGAAKRVVRLLRATVCA